MRYSVREATRADEDSLLELWHGFTAHRSQFDERYKHNENANERWLRYFENQLIDSKYGVVFVAEDDDTGELVGILEARVMGNHPIFRLEDHGQITGHYVPEAFQGEGIGHALIDAAAEWFARDPRAVDFFRVDVLDGNETANGVYRAAGMEPVEHTYEKQLE